MRVTQRMMTDNAIKYMDENLQRLQALQEKVASGKQFQHASDDPANATSALTLRSSLEANQAYLDTGYTAESWMTATDGALGQMVDIAGHAMTLAQQGVSDTLSASERQALASEMNIVLQQAVGVGNATHLDNYIFAGFKTATPAFNLVDNNSDGLYDAVNPRGDNGVILRTVGPGQTISQNINGSAAFSPLFAAIIDARDALLANNSSTIGSALTTLQSASRGVVDARTTNGARQREVRLLTDRYEKTQTELKSLLSLKEDVSMAEAISNLRSQETVYQSVLEVGKRAISAMSLFDILG